MTVAETLRRGELKQLRRLEVVAFVEAVTLLLLLCVAAPLKRFAGVSNAVHVMGPVHGLVFVAYAWTAIQTVSGGGWTAAEATRLLLGAIVPFGGFFNLGFLSRKAAALA